MLEKCKDLKIILGSASPWRARVLKNAGYVFTTMTADIDENKICSADPKKLALDIAKAKTKKLLKKILDLGHESPLEHAVFTFGIEGISRACTHQLVRHRIASYSQQSQRYVDEKEFDYIIPPKIAVPTKVNIIAI